MKKPKWNDDIDLSKYFKDFNTDNYKPRYKLNKYAPPFEKEDIMGNKYQKNRLSPEDRARFARERRALIGTLITQEGFEGALVIEHIRGSQYLLRMPDGAEMYASHKKQRNQESPLSSAGWTHWGSDYYDDARDK